jgi:hypothetical protein
MLLTRRSWDWSFGAYVCNGSLRAQTIALDPNGDEELYWVVDTDAQHRRGARGGAPHEMIQQTIKICDLLLKAEDSPGSWSSAAAVTMSWPSRCRWSAPLLSFAAPPRAFRSCRIASRLLTYALPAGSPRQRGADGQRCRHPLGLTFPCGAATGGAPG